MKKYIFQLKIFTLLNETDLLNILKGSKLPPPPPALTTPHTSSFTQMKYFQKLKFRKQ